MIKVKKDIDTAVKILEGYFNKVIISLGLENSQNIPKIYYDLLNKDKNLNTLTDCDLIKHEMFFKITKLVEDFKFILFNLPELASMSISEFNELTRNFSIIFADINTEFTKTHVSFNIETAGNDIELTITDKLNKNELFIIRNNEVRKLIKNIIDKLTDNNIRHYTRLHKFIIYNYDIINDIKSYELEINVTDMIRIINLHTNIINNRLSEFVRYPKHLINKNDYKKLECIDKQTLTSNLNLNVSKIHIPRLSYPLPLDLETNNTSTTNNNEDDDTDGKFFAL